MGKRSPETSILRWVKLINYFRRFRVSGALILQGYQIRSLDTQAPRKYYGPEKIQTTQTTDQNPARYLDHNHNQLKTYYSLDKHRGNSWAFFSPSSRKGEGSCTRRKLKRRFIKNQPPYGVTIEHPPENPEIARFEGEIKRETTRRFTDEKHDIFIWKSFNNWIHKSHKSFSKFQEATSGICT